MLSDFLPFCRDEYSFVSTSKYIDRISFSQPKVLNLKFRDEESVNILLHC